MRKILFLIQHLICGGVEQSLINLLNALIKDRNNLIVVYAIEKKGEFIDKFPSKVELKEIEIPTKEKKYLAVGGTRLAIRDRIKQHKYIQALTIFKRHLLHKNEFSELNIDFKKIPKLDTMFDIAINYHIHSPFLVKYLDEKIEAKKKYTWIHNDFSTTNYKIKKLITYLNCNELFFAVSNQLKKEFIDNCPSFKEKTEVALNIIDTEKILSYGNEFFPSEFLENKFALNLLTVGRLERQKGYDIAISVCKLLKNDGFKFKWFILGNGSEKRKLKSQLNKSGLQNYFILLGSRLNPYPYFKNCDIYVQTSRHEGYCTTLSEAKIFCKPIVTTNVAGVVEQFEDGSNADIADNSVIDIYQKIKSLMTDKDKRLRYTYALSSETQIKDYTYLRIFNKDYERL